MKQVRFTVIKNAAANLIRGGASAAVAIVLPRFLTHSLDPDRFAAWSLILQIAAYASFLDFGLQTAISRFIAQAIELEQKERQAKLVSTALVLLSIASLIAFTGISIVIWQFPHLFHGMPNGLLPEFRHAASVLSLASCLLLPLSTYTGVLVGMHRNEVPALAMGVTRISGAAAAIIAAHRTHSLTVLALCIGVPNLAGGFIQMAVVQRTFAEGRTHLRHINRVMGMELLRYCAGLSVWSFGMLLVSGLDLTIVAHFQFSAAGYYSVASVLITFFAGLSGAALNALLTPVAALHARQELSRIRQIVMAATRVIMLVNISLTAVIFIWGGPLLRLWVGSVYAANALPILKILAVAQTLRLMVAPYSVMLVSIGEQGKGVSAAICEATVNLIASILGAIFLGPAGVAWGTLIGAVGAVAWIFVRLMPAVRTISITPGRFLSNAVLQGSIPCIPLAIFGLVGAAGLAPWAYATCLILCVASGAWLGIKIVKI